MLLKVALLADSQGLVSSRRIRRAFRKNVLFIAIRGDAQEFSRFDSTVVVAQPLFNQIKNARMPVTWSASCNVRNNSTIKVNLAGGFSNNPW